MNEPEFTIEVGDFVVRHEYGRYTVFQVARATEGKVYPALGTTRGGCYKNQLVFASPDEVQARGLANTLGSLRSDHTAAEHQRQQRLRERMQAEITKALGEVQRP